MQENTCKRLSGFQFLLFVCLLVVLVKVSILLVDREAMLFLGDSATYLVTALEKLIPPDRSFTYGFFVRRIAVKTSSLNNLVWAQTALGVLTCLITAFVLSNVFSVRRWVIVVCTLLCVTEPLQLLFERYVMTEALSLTALALTLLAALFYLRRPRLRTIALFHLAGIGLVSLRYSDFPFVVTTAVWIPLAAVYASNGRPIWASSSNRVLQRLSCRSSTAAIHLAVSLLLLLGFHSAYRELNGHLSEKPPAYLYEGGFFQLAAWAPIVVSEDAPDETAATVIAAFDSFHLRDLKSRPRHRWSPDGIVSRLYEQYENPIEANRVAGQIAQNAALRAPFQLLRLGWRTYLGYWDSELRDPVLEQPPVLRTDPDLPDWLFETLRNRFGLQTVEWSQERETFTRRYYGWARPWYLVILLSPVLGMAALFLSPRRQRLAVGLLIWAILAILGVFCLVSTGWSYRHLHQPGWLTLLLAALLVENLFRRLAVRLEKKDWS